MNTEQKPVRQLSIVALCAQAIRQELKQNFPTTKFKVTSENFSMGDSVNISYVDGESIKKIEAVTQKYKYGHFDGMTDCYEHSNSRDDIPQTKFISVNRNFSDEFCIKAMKQLSKELNISEQTDINKSFDFENDWVSFRELIRRQFYDRDVNDSLLQAISDNDVKAINDLTQKAESGEIIRII